MVDPQTGLGTQVGQYALDVHGGHGTSGVYAYSNADIAETRSRLLAHARGMSGIGRIQTQFDGELRPIKDPRRVEMSDRAGIDSYRSEEHTSELQSLMRISYAVFCLKKKTQ